MARRFWNVIHLESERQSWKRRPSTFFSARLNRAPLSRHLSSGNEERGPTAMQASRILDEYLLASARAGDRAAFGLLARRWQKKLLAHAWRLLGDAEGARDAVQEGWIEIMRGLPGLRDDRAFPAWA